MKNAIQMFPVCICYEYLPEVITGYQLDDLLYAGSIQFIEDIIQQKQRYCSAGPFQEINLVLIQVYKIGFVLPLRTFPLDWEIT